MESITRTLEVNWNGKLQPIQNTIVGDILDGLWEAVEDTYYDKLAESEYKEFKHPIYKDDPSWTS